MALSGKIQQYFGPGNHYMLELDWSATQSTANNTSTVTCQLWMWSDSSWSMYTSATKYGNIDVTPSGESLIDNGISNAGVNTGGGVWLKLGAQTSNTMTHYADGTMSFVLGGDFNFNGVDINGTIINDVVLPNTSFTLDTIPRKSTLSSSPSFTAGNNVSVSISRASSSFTHTVTLWVQNTDNSWNTIATATGVGTSYTFDLTSSAPNAKTTSIFQSLAQRSSCQSSIRVETFDGGTSLGYNDYYGTCSAPAATKATANNFNIGSSVPISLNPANSAFTHTLTWSWVSYSPTIATGVQGTSYSWNTAATDSANSDTFANLMYKQIPNSQSDWGTLHCTTYYGGQQVQQPVAVQYIYGYVVNSNPTFGTGYTYADNKSAITAITGNNQYIVQNASDLLVSLPTSANATAKNYATMSYYVAQCGGKSVQQNYSSSATITFDLGQINLSANDYIYVTAYDSRGFSTQTKIAVNIVPWSPPTVTSTSARNNGFDANTVITLQNGAYAQVSIGGTAKNDIVSVNYQYKQTSAGSYPSSGSGALTAFPSMTHSGGTFSAPNLTVSLDSGSAWNTEVQILDKIMQALSQPPAVIDNTVPIGVPIMFIDTSLKSVGMGRFPVNSNAFEMSGNPLIVGNGTGNANTAWLGFYESDATTRKGWVGDGGTGDQSISLSADVGNVNLTTSWGVTAWFGTDGSSNFQGIANVNGYLFAKDLVYVGGNGPGANSNALARLGVFDRPVGSMVVNLGDNGGGTTPFFDIIDNAWTKVLFRVDNNGVISTIGNGSLPSGQLSAINQEAWTTASLQNSWANYGSSYPSTGYMKDANGMVVVRGAIKSGTLGSGTPAFTLPVGYRPQNDCIFNGIDNNNASCAIYVRASSGYVCIATGANAFISLDGIRFQTKVT